MTDEELLESIAGGNQDRFAILFDRYAPRGLNYSNSMLRNSSDAEDVVQDAFCRVFRSVFDGKFSGNGARFQSYFMKVVRNLTIDRIRQRNRFSTAEGLISTIGSRNIDDDFAGFESRMYELIEQLPLNWREALLMKVAGGQSYEEIAETLGCTHAQVRTWIYRARRQLESEMEKTELMSGKTGENNE